MLCFNRGLLLQARFFFARARRPEPFSGILNGQPHVIEDCGRPFSLSKEEPLRCFLRALSCSGVRGPCRDWSSGQIGGDWVGGFTADGH